MAAVYNELVKFEPPEWAKNLQGIPTHRVRLAIADTPIHSWYDNLPGGFSVSIKRDDLTGSSMSGNKVRKLEFLLADAIQKGCTHVMTTGGEQSNHCRATAIAAAQLKLSCHLFLLSHAADAQDLSHRGNLLLDRMAGAYVYAVPKTSEFDQDIKPRMDSLAGQIKNKSGEKCYPIPVGGSNEVGMFGYLNVFNELIGQGVLDNFDDIFFACGSGGTASGLSIANYLTGSKLKIHGIVVLKQSADYYKHINGVLKCVGLSDVTSSDLVDLIDGYIGEGYAIATEKELEFYLKVARETGIILDPSYTGKAMLGMLAEMEKNPGRFKGKRVLFLHTGGIFGLFDGRMDKIVKKEDSTANRCYTWEHIDKPPAL